MERMMAALGMRAAAMDGMTAQPRWGTVSSVNPAAMQVRVMIQPEGVESGWLPMVALATGSVTVWAPPTLGQQVFMVPDCGSVDDYVVVGLGFSGTARPPKTATAVGGGASVVQPGEFCAVSGGTVLRVSAGGVFIKGNLVVDGDVSDKHGSLDRLRGNYDAHKHTGVTPGGGTSGTTDHVDAE
jgi:phage baseplate assembly protein gpV